MDAFAVLNHVEAWIDSRRTFFAGPAIAVGLTDRERSMGTLAIGEASRGVPLTPDHLFLIASVSKSFTATLVMQELEAGRIDLDAPVQTYLPWFRPASPFGPITVHHLMSHTSGLPMGLEATGEAVNELLQLARQEPGFEPGERFCYSNAAYKALGLILEVTTGRPWFEVARERILEPLDMEATEPTLTFDVVPRLAPAHVSPFGDRPWHTSYGVAPASWYETGTADGTICSNADDIGAYLRAWLRGADRLLSARSVELMTWPHAFDPDDLVNYGYGLWSREVDGRRQVGHSGSFGGFTAFMLFEPDLGIGGVVLTNGESSYSVRLDLLSFALDTARAALAGDDLPQLPTRRTPATIDAPDAFAGTFGPLSLEVREPGLVVSMDGSEGALEAVGDDTFVAPVLPLARFPLRFVRRDGEVVGVAHGKAWYPREGFDAPSSPGHDPAWDRLVGHYRGFGLVPIDVRVVVRLGRLRLTEGILGTDDELVPLGDGSFRVGSEPWSPSRIRFDSEVWSRMTRAIYDGAPLYRTFTD